MGSRRWVRESYRGNAAQEVRDLQSLAMGVQRDEAVKRSKPVQRESAEMQHLWTMIDLQPWAQYYQRFEHRSEHVRESRQRWLEGSSPGFPDCAVFVPGTCPGFCEVKTPCDRPKRGLGLQMRWWLLPRAADGRTHHGVRADQIRWLQILDGCGLRTHVAYDAREAFEFLDRCARAAK